MTKRKAPIKTPYEVPPADKIVNKHNATVTFTCIYMGQPAKPGYIWAQYSWITAERPGMRIINPNRPAEQKFRKPSKAKTIGACQIERSFIETHGETNVKNMVIMNIVNQL